MPASHRKFGDLLEEGIKRVNITRKKPIGYILDEFGYELRPDDSSKGRHALGHWYYKKRIPASMEDVTKLAHLIITNSDVERDWLKAFLESAGHPDADQFCNRYFLPESEGTSARLEPIRAETPVAQAQSASDAEAASVALRRPWLFYALCGVALIGIVTIIARNWAPASPPEILATQTRPPASPTPTATRISATATATTEPTLPTATPTVDFASFDGKCPAVSPASGFDYTSPQSFMDFLNTGGSPAVLQSGFNALIQKKEKLRDGRVAVEDLTGDGIAEVILNAILDKGSLWQILGCNSGKYQALVDIADVDIRYLRSAVDLNGNKLPEIVSYRQTEIENIRLFEFFIQEWNGHQIVDLMDNTRFDEVGQYLPTDITDWNRNNANATATTRDTNSDGLYELVITGGLITPVPTCETRFERQFTEIWAWNGRSFQLADRVYIPPIYRFQRAADGDLAFALEQYDRALTAYQDVLFDVYLFTRDQYLPQLEYCKGINPAPDAPVANEQDLLAAYARWRILLINTIRNSKDAMQVVYQALQEKFPEGQPGHSYAAIASAFWDEYQSSQNVTAACEAANAAAQVQALYPGHAAENVCFVP